MKKLAVITAMAALMSTASANAWWGWGPGYWNPNWWTSNQEQGVNDGAGDLDMDASGDGRGAGRGHGSHGYPYGAVARLLPYDRPYQVCHGPVMPASES